MSQTLTPASQNGNHLYTLTTGLAAVFNLLVLLVLCFVVMPRMELSIAEAAKAREAASVGRELLEANLKRLQGQEQMVIRINRMLDEAAAKAKALEEKKRKEE